MAHVPKTPPPNRRRNNRPQVVSTNGVNHIHQPQALPQGSVPNQQTRSQQQHPRAATSPPQTPVRNGFSSAQPFPAQGGNVHEGAVSDSITSSSTKKKKTRRSRKPKNTDQVVSSTEDERTGAQPKPASHAKPRNDHNHHNSTKPAPAAGMTQAPGATPAKTFYAGPTFHASPAASKLPMPKFSKSVPAEPSHNGFQARLERESSDRSTSPSSSETDTPTTPTVPERREESPLDFLLNAHRNEQARNAGQSRATPPQQPGNHHVRAVSQGSGMFAFELEGSNGHASKGQTPPVAHSPFHSGLQSNPSTQALKERLFQYQNSASPLPTPPPSNLKGSPAANVMNHSPSPVGRPATVQTPPRPDSEQSQFYYGNRNLSPLFQASAADVAKPRSGLRQEFMGGPVMPPATELPNSHSPTSATPTRQNFPQNGAGVYLPQLAQTKENMSFDRPAQPDFRRAHSSHSPNGNTSTHPNMIPSSGPPPPPVPPMRHISDQTHVHSHGHDSSNDIKSMEDNLRRMLNLGARSGNPSGVQPIA